MQLVATTSLQARRPLWSTIAWKTWQRFFKRSAMKAATCLRRLMTQSTGSSGGSWIRKATRLNFGNHQPGNNPHARRRKALSKAVNSATPGGQTDNRLQLRNQLALVDTLPLTQWTAASVN